MNDENPFVGTWRLASLDSRTSDGVVTYPWGRDTKGYYIFSADGYMSVAIMSAQRQRYVSDDMLQGSAKEKVAAAETYISYSGRYETDGKNKLIVHVEVSFFPNWAGQDQERFFEFKEGNNRLTLSTTPIRVEGRELTSHLVWVRVSDGLTKHI